jgi:hypothetical protein
VRWVMDRYGTVDDLMRFDVLAFHVVRWLLLIGWGWDTDPNWLPQIPMDTTNKTSLFYFYPLYPFFCVV